MTYGRFTDFAVVRLARVCGDFLIRVNVLAIGTLILVVYLLSGGAWVVAF